MVEVAVVLIEVDQQYCLAPHLGHGSERIQDFLQEPRALHRAGRPRVLAIDRGRIHPAHLRQFALADVPFERIQVVLGADARQRIGDALVERIGGIVRGSIVGVVRQGLAGIGIGYAGCAATGYREAGRNVGEAERSERAQHVVAPFVRHVLVRDPVDACFFQAFRIGFPGVAPVGRGRQAVDPVPLVIDKGNAGGGAVGSRQVEGAVGIRAGMHRAVIRIAEGERIGQRELERYLLLLEVPHGSIRLMGWPVCHAPIVPGLLAVCPGMGRTGRALRVVGAAVQVIRREHCAVGALLLPYLAAVGQRDGEPVAEAANALECAEVVVERAVLLHQDDHMLDVLDGPGRVVGGYRQCLADAGRKGGQCGGGKARAGDCP